MLLVNSGTFFPLQLIWTRVCFHRSRLYRVLLICSYASSSNDWMITLPFRHVLCGLSVFDLKSIVFFTQVPQFLLTLEVDRGAGTVNFSKMFSNVSLPETHTFKNYKIQTLQWWSPFLLLHPRQQPPRVLKVCFERCCWFHITERETELQARCSNG